MPSEALLVQLEPDGQSFAWKTMQDFVVKQTNREIMEALGDSEDDMPAPTPRHLFYEQDLTDAASHKVTLNSWWLLPLLHRYWRFVELRRAAKAGRSFNIAAWHPWILDAAMTLPQAHPVHDNFEPLCQLGNRVLKVIASLILVVLNPGKEFTQLTKELSAACKTNTLATYMRQLPLGNMLLKSTPDLEAWRPPGVNYFVQNSVSVHGDVPSELDYASVLKALLAVHFLHEPSGLGSSAQLYHFSVGYSQGSSAFGLDSGRVQLTLGHYFAGCKSKHCGRTPTIKRLQECEFILRVHFDESDVVVDNVFGTEWMEYQRFDTGEQPEERGAEGNWQKLTYSHLRSAYLSAHMMATDGLPRPLPNKVCDWLGGKPLISLIRCKSQFQRLNSLNFVRLQERLDSTLHVTYPDCVAVYRRCGQETCWGLGTEQVGVATRSGHAVGIIFSEDLKSFLSPAKDQRLPNLVVEWLFGSSLAQVSMGDFRQSLHRSEYGSSSEDHFCWKYKGTGYKTEYIYTSGGLLFLESEEGSPEKREEYILSDRSQWLSPGVLRLGLQSPALAPMEVVAWMTDVHHRKEVQFQRLFGLRARAAQDPWWRTEFHSRNWWKPLSIPIHESMCTVQRKLGHSFKNPGFLLEAMSHASHPETVGLNHQRLAFLGSALVSLLNTSLAMHDGGYSLSDILHMPPSILSGNRNVRASLWAPSESRNWENNDAPWAILPEKNSSGRWSELLNHVPYALAAVRWGLRQHFLRDSEALDERIHGFTELVRCVDAQLVLNTEVPTVIQLMHLLVRSDVPCVLSDMFFACSAAVFLDSDWNSFRQWFEKIMANVKDVNPCNFVVHASERAAAYQLTLEVQLLSKHNDGLEFERRLVQCAKRSTTEADVLPGNYLWMPPMPVIYAWGL